MGGGGGGEHIDIEMSGSGEQIQKGVGKVQRGKKM